MSRFEKIIIAITGASHLLVHAMMLSLPSLILIIQKDYPAGLDIYGFAVSLSAFLFGLGAIPAGWLDRRFGGRNLLITYQIGSALSSIIITISSSFLGFIIGLSLLGLFCSIYHPTGLTIISQNLKSVSKGMGLHAMFGSLGSAIGPLLAVSISSIFSWRAAYFLFAMLNIVMALVTLLTLSKSKLNINIKTKSNKKSNKRALVYYFITNSFLGMAYYGFTTFMPIHLSLNTSSILAGLSEELKAGIFPTIVFLSGMAGSFFGGKIGEKFDKRKSFSLIIFINIPILLILGVVTNEILVLATIVLGIVYFSNQPIGNTLVADFSDNRNRGLVYGMGFFISFGIGAFAAGISGIVAESIGVHAVFPFMGVLLFPALVFSWLMFKASN